MMTPTRMVTMNPMAEVQAYEILYRKKYSGASVIVINGIFEPVTSPEQLAKLTGRAGAGGLGPLTSFQEILNFEAEHIIELHSVFIQNTNTYKATQQCVSFEKPALILVL